METVQLQCGHCSQLMAVSVEHLGTQVHCPHCEQIVQVPDAIHFESETAVAGPPSGEEDLPKLRISTRDDESILSESPASDDVFGNRTTAPRLELPPPAPRESRRPAPRHEEELPVEAALPAPTIRRPKGESGMFVAVMLMFLIPYAIATTAFIAYLLYQQSKRVNPLESLPDHKPGEGGPRQIQHDLDVTLKTGLQQALRVGDLEVTPLKVVRDPENDLTLWLKMVNISKNIEFNPLHDDFCNFREREGLSVGKPYTFIEPLGKDASARFYGAYAQWQVGLRIPETKDHFYRVRPGEEMLIKLTTRDKDRNRARQLVENPQDVMWRVQVRRGFMPTRHGPKSATCVVGVLFNTAAVEKS